MLQFLKFISFIRLGRHVDINGDQFTDSHLVRSRALPNLSAEVGALDGPKVLLDVEVLEDHHLALHVEDSGAKHAGGPYSPDGPVHPLMQQALGAPLHNDGEDWHMHSQLVGLDVDVAADHTGCSTSPSCLRRWPLWSPPH